MRARIFNASMLPEVSLVSILISPDNFDSSALCIRIRPEPQRKTHTTARELSFHAAPVLHAPPPRPHRVQPHIVRHHIPTKADLVRRARPPGLSLADVHDGRADAHAVALGPAAVVVARVGDAPLDPLVAVVHEVPAAAAGVDLLRGGGGGGGEVLAGSGAAGKVGAVGRQGDARYGGGGAVAELGAAGGTELGHVGEGDGGCELGGD